MESVLSEVVALEDLQRFEKKFNAELKEGNVCKGTKFEYAWCLVRSKYNDDIKKGIVLLEDLLPKGNKEEQRDYIFYLSVANYRLKESVPYLEMAKAKVHPAQITLPDSHLAGATGKLEYEKALKYIRGLLKTEPSNTQALELEKLINKAMQKDGLVGMAIVGGMALGAAGLAGLIGLAIAKSKS